MQPPIVGGHPGFGADFLRSESLRKILFQKTTVVGAAVWPSAVGSGFSHDASPQPGTTGTQSKTARSGYGADPSFLPGVRSEEHTSELQSRDHIVCRDLRETKNKR